MRNMAARIARYCLVRFCQPRPTESIIIKNRSFTMSSIRMQMQSNSGAGGTGSNSSAASQNSNAKIDTAFLARQFINTLDANERKIIKDELIKAENEMQFQFGPDGKKIIASPNWKQLLMVGFQSGLPFIGFGFVDNFLMIVAGDIIESYIGIFLPISTMAAAGLGNGISDVAGIGLSHHIEYYCTRLIGDEIKLTPEQFNLSIVHWVIIIAKSLCIFLGCVIGMSPLLFINHNPSSSEKKDNKTEPTTAK